MAQQIEIHFFALRPTPEWWGDIRSEREEMRARRKAPATAQLDLQFESGNPLLASLGKTGREFLEAITDLDVTREQDHFRAPGDETCSREFSATFSSSRSSRGAPRPARGR